jgi:hypothetical protein
MIRLISQLFCTYKDLCVCFGLTAAMTFMIQIPVLTRTRKNLSLTLLAGTGRVQYQTVTFWALAYTLCLEVKHLTAYCAVQSNSDTECCKHFPSARPCRAILGLCGSRGCQVHCFGDMCDPLWLCLSGKIFCPFWKKPLCFYACNVYHDTSILLLEINCDACIFGFLSSTSLVHFSTCPFFLTEVPGHISLTF